MTMPPKMSYPMPARIIFVVGTMPEPYTMALGGVDTGSMKPQLAPKVAPMAGGIGLTPAASGHGQDYHDRHHHVG